MRSASRIVDSRWAMTSAVRPRKRVLERVLDVRLVLVVEVAGGLVEDHDRRVLQQQPRDRQALLLAAAHPVAALADHGVVAVGQRGDHVEDARAVGTPRRARPRVASGLAYSRLAPIVSWNRCGSWLTTPIAARNDSCVSSRTSWPSTRTAPPVTSYSRGTSDASLVLPDPDAPDQRHGLARLDDERDVLEHITIGIGASECTRRLERRHGDRGGRRVAEPDVVELDATDGVDEIDRARPVDDRLPGRRAPRTRARS